MVIRSQIRVQTSVARFKVQGSWFKVNRAKLISAPHSPLAPASNPEPRTSDLGFTLLELLVVVVIIATLAAIAVPSYIRSIQKANEAVLKEDLYVMRRAIDAYTVDKQQAPQTLDDLVSAGYLHEVPTDPFTHHKDWIPDTSGMLATIDQTDSGGIDNVHSAAQKTALDGTSYNMW